MTMTDDAPKLGDIIADIPANEICLLHNIRTNIELDDDFLDSIGVQGILVRCTVSTGPCEHEMPYVMLAGHRRTTASMQQHGPTATVPCEIVEQDEAERIIGMLVENLQRQDLDPVDEGFAFKNLLGLDMTQAMVAASVGKSDAYVSERIALTALPERAFPLIRAKKLTLENAVKLVRTNNDEVINKILDKVVKGTSGGDIQHDIADAVRTQKNTTEQNKKVKELVAKGWAAGKGKPAKTDGKLSMQVQPKGASRVGYDRVPQLTMTEAQFMKRPDAYAQVLVNYNGVYVCYWSTDGEQYQTGGTSADVTEPNQADERAERVAQQALVRNHRNEFVKGLVGSKLAAAEVVRHYVDFRLGDAIEYEFDTLGEILDSEDEDDIKTRIAAMKAAERFRLLLAVEVYGEANRGIFAGVTSAYIPDIFAKLGYSPSEQEHGWPTESELKATASARREADAEEGLEDDEDDDE